jgi:hypothetical protein
LADENPIPVSTKEIKMMCSQQRRSKATPFHGTHETPSPARIALFISSPKQPTFSPTGLGLLARTQMKPCAKPTQRGALDPQSRCCSEASPVGEMPTPHSYFIQTCEGGVYIHSILWFHTEIPLVSEEMHLSHARHAPNFVSLHMSGICMPRAHAIQATRRIRPCYDWSLQIVQCLG